MVAVAEKRPRNMQRRERLGRRLAELRARAGYSQRSLGEAVGVSESYFGQVESGNRGIDPEVLENACELIKGDYEELSALAGFRKPPRGDAILHVPQAVAPFLRRMSRLPPRVLDILDHLGDRLSEEITEDGSADHPNEEGRQNQQEH